MKRKPKPRKAWGVYGPRDRLPQIVSSIRDRATFNARSLFSMSTMQTWAYFEVLGYRCVRVEVREIVK